MSDIFEDDFELVEAVIHLADLPTSGETPGVADDPEMDTLIMAARRIQRREGLVCVTNPTGI